MFIHQYIKIGSNHKNFCEDFILKEKIGDKYILTGVFDGCSSGKDSHFASTLIAKIIKSEAKKISINGIKKDFLKKVIFESLVKLKQIKKGINTSTDELLSTIILLFIDVEKKEADIMAIGDGFISINGENTVIEQDNTPKYAAYFLDEFSDYLSYEELLKNIAFTIKTGKINDITISTDGILSFEKFETNKTEQNVIEYLSKDKFLYKNKVMLGRKVNILKSKFSMINQDDLAIVRIIL